MVDSEDFPYNDREFEAFKKYELNGIDVPVKSVRNGEHAFVDKAMGEPKRIITKMIRVLAPDWNDKGLKKDYLWYLERWEGVDFIGNPINPVNDHIEGYYDEPVVKRTINTKTNMPIKMTRTENNQLVQTEHDKLKVENVRRVYYIPFSKKTLDQILQDTNNWENRDSITYKLKVSPSHTPDDLSYEQFANWDFKTAAAETLKVGGARAHPYVAPEPVIKQKRVKYPELTKDTIRQIPDTEREVQKIEEEIQLD